MKVYVKEVQTFTIAYDGKLSENGVSRLKASRPARRLYLPRAYR